MNLLIILRVALRSLRRTLLRSSLTALGIIIGVAAVIAMVSIGNGAKARVEESLAGLDSNQLILTAQMPRSQWRRGVPLTLPLGDGLKLDDYQAIRSEIHGVAAASVQVNLPTGGIRGSGRASEANISGIDAEGFQFQSRRLLSGATFGASDVRTAAGVCLITRYLAQNLFDNRDPLGRIVRIKDVPFVVIGMLADDENQRDPRRAASGDTSIFIPYTSLLRRLDRTAPLMVALKAEQPTDLGRIEQEVRDLLESRRGNRIAEFTTGNVEEAIRRYREGSQTMTLLLGVIAGISLLVGGIGIMNIMLVSVTERTREIGIRLAIGTRGRDVLRQFLIEAVILSVLGGTIGIILGAGVAYTITYLNDWPTRVTLDSVLAAFLCSAAIGVFFGYYPARQAAQLDPIEALRSE